MAQHDYNIANQSGAGFRSDLNNALAAIVSQNSGASQPSTTYAYQWWADTTTGLLKIRNAANNAWIEFASLTDATIALSRLAAGALPTNVTVASANIVDGSIVDADVNASAAIAGTKITAGTTSVRGTLQLTNSTNSTNTTTAATPANVKTAVDNAASAQATANAALPKAGGTMTGDINFRTVQPRVARAWINYDSTGAQSMRASFNVAGITDLGGFGSTRITFTNAMPDVNYAVVGAAHTTASGAAIVRPQVLNTGNVEIQTENGAGADVDCSIVGVAIFR
jgi:hypothetical protein